VALTERIKGLTEHLQKHKKDHYTRRRLLMIVKRRRRVLEFLRREDFPRYIEFVKKSGFHPFDSQ